MIDIEEFGKNKRAGFAALRSLNKGALDSKAVEAVLLIAEKAIDMVVEKHPKRGDSWEEAFTSLTCYSLAGAKIKRIEILHDITPDQMSLEEINEEIIEEAGDAVAYIAFGVWKVDRT